MIDEAARLHPGRLAERRGIRQGVAAAPERGETMEGSLDTSERDTGQACTGKGHAGIRCPSCGCTATEVRHTRRIKEGIIRYRRCCACSRTFSTKEVVVAGRQVSTSGTLAAELERHLAEFVGSLQAAGLLAHNEAKREGKSQ